MSVMIESRVYKIYAGVNGAGKSTLYGIEKSLGEERVNSDEILQSLSGNWRVEKDQMIAMREAVRRINHYINEGISFNQETTLAGRSILNTIKKAKEKGFYICLNYVGLESADLAVQRVNERVKTGGHGIPEEVIRKRYQVSLAMLKEVLPLCDNISIYDNSKDLLLVALYENERWSLKHESCQWFNKNFSNIDFVTNLKVDFLKPLDEIKMNSIAKTIEIAGFEPTKNLSQNLHKLNSLTGRHNTFKDVKDMFKSGVGNPEIKKVLEDIVKECKEQEISSKIKQQVKDNELER